MHAASNNIVFIKRGIFMGPHKRSNPHYARSQSAVVAFIVQVHYKLSAVP